MSRISALNARYSFCDGILHNGVEIVRVADPYGTRLNLAARKLLSVMREGDPEPWADLAGAVNAVRWRLITRPQPASMNTGLRELAEHVAAQANLLRGAAPEEELLDELAEAAQAVSEVEPALGAVLRSSIEEVGPSACIVVPASGAARADIQCWLSDLPVRVMTTGDLRRKEPQAEKVFAVGPPRFFRPSLVTAPPADEVSFILPSWFSDYTVPKSEIAPYADNAIQVTSRVFTVGDANVISADAADSGTEEALQPAPEWGSYPPLTREPANDEVIARKILLSGNQAIWLDDGGRIRALDPDQPAGERVVYCDIPAVRTGSYLLLRHGATEQGALYAAALQLLGAHAEAADASQRAWKHQLARTLTLRGTRAVVDDLRKRGVTAADRAPAWAGEHLIRPNSDQDFKILLTLLGIPAEPSLTNATRLRQLVHQASADVREKLESAVSGIDLLELDQNGHVRLEVGQAGLRGISATRVLAISPHRAIVPRHDVRLPFHDRGARWLE